jgi:hypothetical protein
MFIPDLYFLSIPDSGSRGQKGTRSRISDPDPHQWEKKSELLFIKAVRCSARIRFCFGFLLKIKGIQEISFELCGTQDPDNPDIWRAEPLTRDHKPESLGEYLI